VGSTRWKERLRPALGLAALVLCGLTAGYMALDAARGHLPRPPVLTFTAAPRASLALPTPAPTGLNLNTADRAAMMGLPGIGSHLAEQIVRQREEHPFYFLEDLRQVPGIGEKRLQMLRGLAHVPAPPEPTAGRVHIIGP